MYSQGAEEEGPSTANPRSPLSAILSLLWSGVLAAVGHHRCGNAEKHSHLVSVTRSGNPS